MIIVSEKFFPKPDVLIGKEYKIKEIRVKGSGDMNCDLCSRCVLKMDNLLGSCRMQKKSGGYWIGGYDLTFVCYALREV